MALKIHFFFIRNCLFRALSDQLYGTPEKHQSLRQETVNYMKNHRQDFEPFQDESLPFDTHLECLSRDGTYAGNDSLVAFAKAKQVTIAIHQLNEPLWQIHGSANGETKCPVELHISYHNGDHYNSIRKPGQVNTGSPPNIKLNVKDDAPEHSLWGCQGTGSRIFGPEVSDQARQGQKKMSAKARKKYEKRQVQHNEDNLPVQAVEALSL